MRALIETIRRECLDFLIPTNEWHLKRILKEYVTYYKEGRRHSFLGPGIPEPTQARAAGPPRHKLPKGYRVMSKPVLGGVHHEYSLKKEAA